MGGGGKDGEGGDHGEAGEGDQTEPVKHLDCYSHDHIIYTYIYDMVKNHNLHFLLRQKGAAKNDKHHIWMISLPWRQTSNHSQWRPRHRRPSTCR